jgi:hypothetical protein
MIVLTEQDQDFLEKQLEEFRIGYYRDNLDPILEAIKYKSPPATIATFLAELETIQYAPSADPKFSLRMASRLS